MNQVKKKEEKKGVEWVLRWRPSYIDKSLIQLLCQTGISYATQRQAVAAAKKFAENKKFAQTVKQKNIRFVALPYYENSLPFCSGVLAQTKIKTLIRDTKGDVWNIPDKLRANEKNFEKLQMDLNLANWGLDSWKEQCETKEKVASSFSDLLKKEEKLTTKWFKKYNSTLTELWWLKAVFGIYVIISVGTILSLYVVLN